MKKKIFLKSSEFPVPYFFEMISFCTTFERRKLIFEKGILAAFSRKSFNKNPLQGLL